MKSEFKKLVTDINRGKDLDVNLPKYIDNINALYNYYATVKISMNYYTLSEMLEDINSSDLSEGIDEDVSSYIGQVSDLLKKYLLEDNSVAEEDLSCIKCIREKIESKMKIITSYTDAFEIYEYILNRVEAKVNGIEKQIDVDELSASAFKYIFSENDTVVINSKLQLIMSQLPVRMTKNKFYDVVTNTLSIYKGGERKSLNDFVDMLKKTVLIELPDNFDKEYPMLRECYALLKSTDYKTIDLKLYNDLSDGLKKAVKFIEEVSTLLVLFEEIINDTYAIMLSNQVKDMNKSKPGYKGALNILMASFENNLDFENENILSSFMSIEGVQEDVLESVLILQSAEEGLLINEESEYKPALKNIDILGKLLSTSLFADLSDADIDSEVADGDYIMQLRESFVAELSKLFDANPMIVNRSMMCKLLSAMPIFLNTQQEIKDYLDYVLTNCRDNSELIACSKIINDLIEEA